MCTNFARIKEMAKSIFDVRQHPFGAFSGIHYEMLALRNLAYRQELCSLVQIDFLCCVRRASPFAGSLPQEAQDFLLIRPAFNDQNWYAEFKTSRDYCSTILWSLE